MFWSVKLYINIKAKKEKCLLPQNYIEIFNNYKNINTPIPCKINFVSYMMKNDSLKASANVPNCIILNSRWAYQIVSNNNEQTKNAFRITIGHELTHKEGELIAFKYKKKSRKIINWINEVHCDFAGTEKMEKRSRISLVDSCDYKRRNKTAKADSDTDTHPSWTKRAEYARNYDFDERLIARIIDDTGIKLSDQEKEKIISDVFSKFERIYLSPQPEI